MKIKFINKYYFQQVKLDVSMVQKFLTRGSPTPLTGAPAQSCCCDSLQRGAAPAASPAQPKEQHGDLDPGTNTLSVFTPILQH